MIKSRASDLEWDERPSAPEVLRTYTDSVFESLFERSADAILLYELHGPHTLVLVDCNKAAVELIGAGDKWQLLRMRPEDLSAPVQLDGSGTASKTAEIIALVQRQNTHRFEWVMRRLDGRDVPIEVSATAVLMGGKNIPCRHCA